MDKFVREDFKGLPLLECLLKKPIREKYLGEISILNVKFLAELKLINNKYLDKSKPLDEKWLEDIKPLCDEYWSNINSINDKYLDLLAIPENRTEIGDNYVGS